MKTYRISFSYSRDGERNWTNTSMTVKAESDMAAIAQVESSHPYVKNIKIVSVK